MAAANELINLLENKHISANFCFDLAVWCYGDEAKAKEKLLDALEERMLL